MQRLCQLPRNNPTLHSNRTTDDENHRICRCTPWHWTERVCSPRHVTGRRFRRRSCDKRGNTASSRCSQISRAKRIPRCGSVKCGGHYRRTVRHRKHAVQHRPAPETKDALNRMIGAVPGHTRSATAAPLWTDRRTRATAPRKCRRSVLPIRGHVFVDWPAQESDGNSFTRAHG